jgi:uncharacterized protein
MVTGPSFRKGDIPAVVRQDDGIRALRHSAEPTATLDPQTPVTQDVHRIVADGDYAVAEWTSHARARNGAPYDNDYAVVFRVAGGLIDAVTEYCDTSYMKRVLFGQ